MDGETNLLIEFAVGDEAWIPLSLLEAYKDDYWSISVSGHPPMVKVHSSLEAAEIDKWCAVASAILWLQVAEAYGLPAVIAAVGLRDVKPSKYQAFLDMLTEDGTPKQE